MRELSLFELFVDPLNRIGIRYMITGAVASMIYGEPRLTHDIDLVVELGTENAEKMIEVYPANEFYCPPVEVIKVEIKRDHRGHFNLIHHETGFKADVYLMGEDSLHDWGMSKRRQIDIEGKILWVAPPEYVIIRKLQYFREGGSEKHLRDIAGMVEISREQIDFNELENKINENSMGKEWEEVRKIVEK